MMDFRNYDVVYADAEEKFVKNVILYGSSADKYIYAKSTKTEADKIDKDTLMELLKKGVMIYYTDTFYTPVSFKDETTKTSVVVTDSVTLYSKEHSED